MRKFTFLDRSRILLAVAVSATVAVVGAQAAYAAPGPPAASAESSEHSGEDLFRAIVFGDVDRAPELDGHVPELVQTPEAQEVVDSIIAEIDSANPQFFDDFAADLTSGDAHAVEASLNDAASVMGDSLVELGYADEDLLVSPSWAALAVFVFAAAAVVVGGIAVLTVQAVSTASVFWGPRATATGDFSLEQEKQIAALAETLN